MDPRKLGAEALGTFWLVLGGCGAAVLSAGFANPDSAIGFMGVSFAFGFTVLTGAYALGHVSGGHFNPAITIGLTAAKRFPAKDAVGYVVVQVIAAIAAAGVLFVIASGIDSFDASAGMASNGFDDLSPGGYNLASAAVTEIVMTAMFLIVIMGATRKSAPNGTAPIAIGIALVLIHLISIPVTNTSVNPARSTGPALFAGGDYIEQLWLFWLAPIVGAVIGAVIYRAVLGDRIDDIDQDVSGDPEESIS